MKTSPSGIAFIKAAEGLRLKPYVDIAGVKTIGYGHTGGATQNESITEAEAERLLVSVDLFIAEHGVARLVTVPLRQHEFDALVSFVLNVGTDIDADDKAGGLGDSTLLRLLNAKDRVGAAAEFSRWHHASGKRSRGLLIRRLREALMFLGE